MFEMSVLNEIVDKLVGRMNISGVDFMSYTQKYYTDIV